MMLYNEDAGDDNDAMEVHLGETPWQGCSLCFLS